MKALTEDVTRNLICEDCNKHHNEYIGQNRSAVLYNSFIREKIALYKYRGKESLSEVFSYLLITSYDTYYLNEEIDIITYIPLHHNRLLERGFNQSEQLAQKLGEYAGLPVLDTLIRTKASEKQSKKSRNERLREIEGSFKLKESTIPLIENKKILIIDDIYTTGSTLSEAAKEIDKSRPKDVFSLTFARAIDQKKDDKMDFFV